MKNLTNNPIDVTIPILERFAKNVGTLDEFYEKKEREDGKLLQKTN